MPLVKHRLLIEQLDTLVIWLETFDDSQPELFGSRDEYEWLLRLAAIVGSLLDRHMLDDHGRCRSCTRPPRGWRRLLPRWPRRVSCQVLRAAAFFTKSDIATVWWQVFARRGDPTTLEEVRAWLHRKPDEPHKQPIEGSSEHHALLSDGRVRLRDDTAPDESSRIVRPYARPGMPTEQFLRSPAARSEANTEVLPKINEP